MDKVALLIRLQAKKGKETEVEKFLSGVLPNVENELTTSIWHALRLDPSTYIIFDTFPDDEGRQAHLSGKVAKALEEKSSELFSQPPTIEKLDVIAVKMPEVVQY
ncbi:MAG TPA: antibiotic biosynthesis monooxygenase [Chitinophagaceae bacterium]|jgi:quinol monooxygenase YgiN|nr:antibiotic biosynthesis monooxygenase [Chitinophagaceae bacterium]